MTKAKRIILAGVPFGCNNIGDEAILESIVGMLRTFGRDIEITVSAREKQTLYDRLQISTCPLLGHDVKDQKSIAQIIRGYDAVMWAGATGLSDYPEVALPIWDVANNLEIPSIVFCVGMNRQLNPHLYKVVRGRRWRVCEAIRRLSLGAINPIGLIEKRKVQRALSHIGRTLATCNLILVRDQESCDVLHVTNPALNIQVGADPALLIEPEPLEDSSIPDRLKQCLASESRKVGICVSAQSPIGKKEEIIRFLNSLMKDPKTDVWGIPMNPTTDGPLMEKWKGSLESPHRFFLLENIWFPETVAAIAGRMDLVISSRLHLLILASISHVPLLGIARGSKIENFLDEFGEKPVGSVDDFEASRCLDKAFNLLSSRNEYVRRSTMARERLLSRLGRARQLLKKTVSG